jgi:glycosyltransferase involved in cell wall biosynthesis
VITAIVTTRNSARTLEACLRSVRAQEGPRPELVVVDNFSTDDTQMMGKRYSDRFEQAGPERSRQRNIGAAMASNRYLLFLDSDMVLPGGILMECLEECAKGSEAVIIPEISFGLGYWTACKALERSCYPGDDTIESPRFIDRQLFDQVSGFDEQLWGGEDWDLTARLRERGARMSRIKTALLHDEGKLTLLGAMRTKYYYGRSMPIYIRKHPDLARRQLKLLRPAFFKHLDLLARRPWLTVGMFTLKTCEVLSGAFGTAVAWRGSTPSTRGASQHAAGDHES